jgi:hypothetical protein
MPFTQAIKTTSRVRFGISGPSGSGKTYSALGIASGLGDRVAVIDTEHGSASLYADVFSFDVLELSSFHPQMYIDAITQAIDARYDVLVIDSLSHAWMGKDGALELAGRAAEKSKGNTYVAWRDVTPLHTRLIESILSAPCHVIVTFRSKTEYIMVDTRGKQVPQKVGLAPVQREGIEYEFGLFGEIDHAHDLRIIKSRYQGLADRIFSFPDADTGRAILAVTGVDIPQHHQKDPIAHDLKDALAKLRLITVDRLGLNPDDIKAELRAFAGKEKVSVDHVERFYMERYEGPWTLIQELQARNLAALQEALDAHGCYGKIPWNVLCEIAGPSQPEKRQDGNAATDELFGTTTGIVVHDERTKDDDIPY